MYEVHEYALGVIDTVLGTGPRLLAVRRYRWRWAARLSLYLVPRLPMVVIWRELHPVLRIV